MTTLDLKLQMRANNHGKTIHPKCDRRTRGYKSNARSQSYRSTPSGLVLGGRELTRAQAFDHINRSLYA